MATYTDNCNLILPAKSENYDVDTANTNNQIIDTQLGNKVNKVPGKGLSTNDFTKHNLIFNWYTYLLYINLCWIS